MEGLPASSGVSARLWADSQDLVYACLHHPFVIGLGQGALPREAFQCYIGQDAHFLHGFADAYRAALGRAASPGDALLRNSLEELLAGVEDELRLHESYAKEWGVNLREHEKPGRATAAYLNYVHGIANNPAESVGSILSALVPCLRLYAFLGCQLAKARPQEDADHPYSEWVATYSSPEYLRLPDMAESVLNHTGESVPYEKLLKQYRSAMKLEADFFSAQPYTPPKRAISLLVTDFDDTCSKADTISVICKQAIAAAVKQAGDTGEFAEQLQQQLEGTLQSLVRNYAARRSALLEEILPEVEEAPEEFDMGWLGDFIDRLSEFDREMNQVVVDSGILGGIRKGALSDAGTQIPMMDGCLEVLQRAVAAGIPTAVVSVNWSAEMVRSALAQRGLPVVLADAESSTALQEGTAVVYANELEYFGEQSTGTIKRRVECAADKGHVFDELLLNVAIEGSAQDGITVFVGDSMTDIPALISADVGILLGSNPLVQQVALAAGIELLPLVAAPLDAQRQDHAQCTLYEAASWKEIEAFLFNQQFDAPKREPKRLSSMRESEPFTAAGRVPCVLAIAGSDSGGGAGIQADVKACGALGVFASTAITALTAQNTHGVDAVHVAPADIVRKQISAVLSDMGADVVKTGMLPTPEIVEAVAEELQRHGVGSVVVDPVLVSTSGDPLATGGVVEAIQTHLMPLATIITPNISEASALLGGKAITDLEDMRHAVRALHQFGSQWVLLKGGHLVEGSGGEDSTHGGNRLVTDVLFDGRNMVELTHPYIKTSNNHGTGCTLASAIAAELAKGRDVPGAVRRARRYLWRVVERSVDLPIGKGQQKPMNHLHRVADWVAELGAAAGTAGGGEGAQQAQQARRDRIPNPVDLRVYAVTDPDCNAKWDRGNAEAVRLALDGGTTIVQLREKKCDGGIFMQQAAEVLEVCRARRVPLLINDRVDVALAVDADGVHVGQDDLPAVVVRRMIGPDKLLGVSVKTVEEALKAQADGADYVGAGAVYHTDTKESSAIGLDALAEICRAVRIPVVAIGGIKAGNASDSVAAGAAGVAIVSGIFAAESPADAAREVRRVVDDALAQRGQ